MNKKIDSFKELLNVLPRNNVKNSRVYFQKATLMKEEAERFRKSLLREINTRYKELVLYNDNEDLKVLKNYLEDIKNKLYLLNDYNDSYEKSGLDVSLYKLKKFYKNDLLKVNQNIKTIVDKFSLVGVGLTSDEFTYGKEVNEYMRTFLSTSDINSTELKNSFDKLYWKESDIIEYIYLNFRYLYFKYKANFDKYYANKLVEYSITDKKKYLDDYQNSLWNYLILKDSNIKMIQDKFLNGDLDIKEYEDSKIEKIEASIIDPNVGDNEKMESFNKLSSTLYEYKNYLRFVNIFTSIKELYKGKEANKNLTKTVLKNIAKSEGTITKVNRKMRFKLRFNANANLDKFYLQIKESITELKKLYAEYDEAKFKETIATKLKDESSILDTFRLALGFKINLIGILKSSDETLDDQALEKEINDLEEFSYYPNNTFIRNIKIIDEKEIPLIILDKYKLMNINIQKEQLDDVNLDNFISNVNKLVISSYLKKNNISYSDMNNLCEMYKMIEVEKE